MILLFIGMSGVVWQESVNVYAVVWQLNRAPRISNINPSDDPLLVARSSLESPSSIVISFFVEDLESEDMNIAISSDDGSVNPSNTTISWSWDINLVYLAPTDIWTWFYLDSRINIVVSDTVNPVVHQINLLIY